MANYELCSDKKCNLRRTCVRSTFISHVDKGQKYIPQRDCSAKKNEMYFPITLDNAKHLGMVRS